MICLIEVGTGSTCASFFATPQMKSPHAWSSLLTLMVNCILVAAIYRGPCPFEHEQASKAMRVGKINATQHACVARSLEIAGSLRFFMNIMPRHLPARSGKFTRS